MFFSLTIFAAALMSALIWVVPGWLVWYRRRRVGWLLGVSAVLGGVFLTLSGLGFVAERLHPSASPDLDPFVGSVGLGMTILAGGTAFATLVAFDASRPEDQRTGARSTLLDRTFGMLLLLATVYAMVEVPKP